MGRHTIHLWVEYHRKKEEKYVYYPAVKDDEGNVIDEEDSKILGTEWTTLWVWGEFLTNDILMAALLAQFSEGNSDEKETRGLPKDVSVDVKKNILSYSTSHEVFSSFDNIYSSDPIDIERFRTINGPGAGDIHMDIEVCKPNPRFYGFGWCDAKELESCVKKVYYDENTKKYNPDAIDWLVLLGAMNTLNNMDNIECRAVFWFED